MNGVKNNEGYMASIKQNPEFSNSAAIPAASTPPLKLGSRLPDFRNLGVCLRLLFIVNALVLLVALFQAEGWVDITNALSRWLAFIQPSLLLSLLLLYAAYPRLSKLGQISGISGVFGIVLFSSTTVLMIGQQVLDEASLPSIIRVWLLSALITAISLYYFDLRRRVLTPAIAEARLQALQARIRPHFLFNSINAVLSLIRSQPARAEEALEDMADLFRVLMADNRHLVPLAKELALSRQYLALEKLRLEERLNIVWQIENMPPDALIPPLILQPLLENAVYHGIEPLENGGEITIKIYTLRDEIHLIMRNPYPAQGSHHTGNRMALGNIRERLALHYDVEAILTSKQADQMYEVHIMIPYKRDVQQ